MTLNYNNITIHYRNTAVSYIFPCKIAMDCHEHIHSFCLAQTQPQKIAPSHASREPSGRGLLTPQEVGRMVILMEITGKSNHNLGFA